MNLFLLHITIFQSVIKMIEALEYLLLPRLPIFTIQA